MGSLVQDLWGRFLPYQRYQKLLRANPSPRPVDRGLYLADGWEGEVSLDRGIFQGRAANARLVEHGQVGETLRDTTVTGNVFETLRRIDLVGNDVRLTMPGHCEKSGQEVCTDGGGPHLRVQGLLVGGEEDA